MARAMAATFGFDAHGTGIGSPPAANYDGRVAGVSGGAVRLCRVERLSRYLCRQPTSASIVRSTSCSNRRSRCSRRSTAFSRKSTKSCAACRTSRSAPRNRPRARLERIVGVMPQVQVDRVIGSDGRAARVERRSETSPGADFADRDYFKAQVGGDRRDLCQRRARQADAPGGAGDFFVLSHRLGSADGSFRGVIAVAVRPRYFENFYTLVGQTPGNFYALVRTDGAILARYPSRHGRYAAAQCRPACSSRDRQRLSSAASVHRQIRARRHSIAASVSASSRAFRFMRLPASRPARSGPNGFRRSAHI